MHSCQCIPWTSEESSLKVVQVHLKREVSIPFTTEEQHHVLPCNDSLPDRKTIQITKICAKVNVNITMILDPKWNNKFVEHLQFFKQPIILGANGKEKMRGRRDCVRRNRRQKPVRKISQMSEMLFLKPSTSLLPKWQNFPRLLFKQVFKKNFFVWLFQHHQNILLAIYLSKYTCSVLDDSSWGHANTVSITSVKAFLYTLLQMFDTTDLTHDCNYPWEVTHLCVCVFGL